jgi:hypothetical protein
MEFIMPTLTREQALDHFQQGINRSERNLREMGSRSPYFGNGVISGLVTFAVLALAVPGLLALLNIQIPLVMLLAAVIVIQVPAVHMIHSVFMLDQTWSINCWNASCTNRFGIGTLLTRAMISGGINLVIALALAGIMALTGNTGFGSALGRIAWFSLGLFGGVMAYFRVTEAYHKCRSMAQGAGKTYLRAMQRVDEICARDGLLEDI